MGKVFCALPGGSCLLAKCNNCRNLAHYDGLSCVPNYGLAGSKDS